MKIDGIMLGSENPEKLAEFYTTVLGEPGMHDGDWYGYNAGGNLMIGPHSEVKGANTEPARIMIMISSDDVPGEFARVKAAGGVVIAEPYHPREDAPEMWLSTLADPDGNYVQIASPWKP